MRMKKLVFIFIIFLFYSSICYGAPEINNIPLKVGTVLVYQDQLESQYVPGDNSYDEYVEVYDKDNINDKIEIGRKSWEHTEKVSAVDNGLRYGSPIKVGMEWDSESDFKRDDHMYCKYVEKIEDVTVQAGTFRNCFKIVSKEICDKEVEWYCPGVGIIKYEYHHNGTITNKTYELKQIVNSNTLGGTSVSPFGQ